MTAQRFHAKIPSLQTLLPRPKVTVATDFLVQTRQRTMRRRTQLRRQNAGFVPGSAAICGDITEASGENGPAASASGARKTDAEATEATDFPSPPVGVCAPAFPFAALFCSAHNSFADGTVQSWQLPPGTGMGHRLEVDVSGQTCNCSHMLTFHYRKPSIISITTTSAVAKSTEGGYNITISGNDFGNYHYPWRGRLSTHG